MTMTPDPTQGSCPALMARYPRVTMAHGGGGRLTQRLIKDIFARAFDNPMLERMHDGAVFESGGARMAMTTDGFVVRPLFFPGGDIGKLAVCGTVNDLAMCGARPMYLSASFIIEEGLPVEDLQRVADSMARTASEAGVAIVTGDTKVVERGHGDGIYITTAGVGVVRPGLEIDPRRVEPGAALIVSGDLGRHGMAVMAAREGLEFETPIESDCAPLNGLAGALLNSGAGVQCLRDLTRGGLSTAVIEIAESCGFDLELEESAIDVPAPVAAAAGLLGLDPLLIANEGRMLAIVEAAGADRALAAMRAHPLGGGSRVIGRVLQNPGASAIMLTPLGTRRILDMPSGEQLPRIC